MEDADRLFYSGSEVAKILGISKALVTFSVRNGRIAAARIGNRLLIPTTEVERLQSEAFTSQQKARQSLAGTRA